MGDLFNKPGNEVTNIFLTNKPEQAVTIKGRLRIRQMRIQINHFYIWEGVPRTGDFRSESCSRNE